MAGDTGMKPIRLYVAAALLLLFANPLTASAAGGLEGTLRQVVEDNLAAYNSEDASRALASVHTKSPAYADMQDALPKQFAAMDARTELERFTYIGHDGEFALARVQYRTTDGSQAPFMDNVLDTITVFHQEDGTWKYWDNYLLGGRIVQ
jgi:hypothetical protein